MKYIGILFILTLHLPILADSKPIEGEYWVDGQFLIDTPENQFEDSHVYFRLEGESAQDLYQLLDVEPQWNQCGRDHWEKTQGKVSCEFYESSDNYYCYFSIDVRDGSLDYGPPC